MTNKIAIEYLKDMLASAEANLHVPDMAEHAEALNMAIEALSAQPEVIRCKDCENWDTTWQNDWGKNYHYCPLIDAIRNGDFYCADAERKDNEID